jgi:membrane protein
VRRAAGEGELRRAVAVGRALIRRFSRDRVLDNAAALTYYALLAVFPGLIGVVAALSLSGIGDTLFAKGLDG